MKRKYKRVYRQLRLPLEWGLIRVGQLVIPPLTVHGLMRLANCLGDMAWRLDRRGKAIARQNLKLMFGPHMTPHRERAIIRGSYRNMARVLFNIFWMTRKTLTRIRRHVLFTPSVLTALRADQPAITISAHIGNWEILSQACVANGIPMMSVAKETGSPGITRCLTRSRSTIGQQIVPAEGATRPLIHALKHGTSIGLLIDQHVHVWDGGTWVNLFGVPAGISLAPAALSRKLNVPIFFAWSRPMKNGDYRIEPGQIFRPSPEQDDASVTQQIATAFERVIRRHPSLWCLNYRRWRYILPDDDPARYPAYAHMARRTKTPE